MWPHRAVAAQHEVALEVARVAPIARGRATEEFARNAKAEEIAREMEQAGKGSRQRNTRMRFAHLFLRVMEDLETGIGGHELSWIGVRGVFSDGQVRCAHAGCAMAEAKPWLCAKTKAMIYAPCGTKHTSGEWYALVKVQKCYKMPEAESACAKRARDKKAVRTGATTETAEELKAARAEERAEKAAEAQRRRAEARTAAENKQAAAPKATAKAKAKARMSRLRACSEEAKARVPAPRIGNSHREGWATRAVLREERARAPENANKMKAETGRTRRRHSV